MAIPARVRADVRNRMRDVTLHFSDRKEGRTALEGTDVRFSDVRRERMNCSLDPEKLYRVQDWTRNTVEMEKCIPVQPVREAKATQKLFTREGIRWTPAVWGLSLLAALLLAVLLIDLAGMGQTGKQIEKLNRKIATVTSANEQLKWELSLSDSDMSVLTEAVKLNLVSSGSNIIKLYAPTDATLSLTANDGVSGDNLAMITGD